ncbi:type VI secretion system baseplate subunit TssG [Dyella sp.]|uniref:type VI secretion system baseplate subunit TssG n=1 Tax=Dyella sp. TaxID=1869338 RepID=UPI002ED2A660
MNTTDASMEFTASDDEIHDSRPRERLAGAVTVPGLVPHAPLDTLLRHPERFDFFQAVRLLYRAHGTPPRQGAGADRDHVRFGVPANLFFPPSELHALAVEPSQASSAPRYAMKVNFIGLTGPSGELPRHYTEWLVAQMKARDTASRDFLDLFNHRLIALFWRAWARHRIDVSEELDSDVRGQTLLRHIYDIIGLGTPALYARVSGPHAHGLPARALGYYSGLVAQKPRGVGTLAQIAGDVVGAHVSVLGCHGTWQKIPLRDRTRLGAVNHRIGAGVVLGSQFWDRQMTIRMRIGPLSGRRFDQLLPQGELLEAVVELLRFLAGQALDLDIQLLLHASDVPGARLGGAKPARLGWNSWLTGRRSRKPADECRFVFAGLG